MMVMILMSVFFCAYFYIQAIRYAMPAKRWAFLGLCGGPMFLPLFVIKQHISVRKAAGYNNLFFRA
ncbi:hypothetical protein [Opacimonas viscosa]|uniref:Uncharacterized protein n=1 Tax=Opacimonas viscosa TaxID=2961944 RepID=A0AA42BLB1_9ALTE|nr:hypothetical protein [Opacimonas viscosa]MCP3428635.1 hypothetical protein [Opacimonas viscosa]